MPYQFTTGSSGITSFPALLSMEISAPLLVVNVRNLVLPRKEWIRAGLIQAISQTEIGAVAGKPQYLVFDKKTEIKLDIPAYPYQIQFSPKHWVTRWEIEIYSKDKAWADGTPSVPLVETAKGRVRRTILYTPNTQPSQVLQPRENRTSATLYNASTSLIYIGFSSNLSPSNAPETLYPGGQWTLDGGDIGEIWMMSNTASSDSLQIIEYSQD